MIFEFHIVFTVDHLNNLCVTPVLWSQYLYIQKIELLIQWFSNPFIILSDLGIMGLLPALNMSTCM